MFYLNDLYAEDIELYMTKDPRTLLPKTLDALIEGEDIEGIIDQGFKFDSRSVSIECVLLWDDVDEQRAKLSLLMTELVRDSIKIKFKDQDDRYLDCIFKGNLNLAYTGGRTELVLDFVANNPLWQSVAAHSSINPSNINNQGNHMAKPKLIIDGPATTPSITIGNTTISYGLSLTGADKLIIDCDKMTATFNGVLATKDITGNYPSLDPGDNAVSCSSGILTINWNDCWL